MALAPGTAANITTIRDHSGLFGACLPPAAGQREHETANAIPMNMKRMRGRGGHRQGGGGGGGQFRQTGGGGGGGNQPMNRNHVFDSSGPDMRLRGTAQQLFEKYLQLGRDATGSGDRVMAESYFQHAEHYFRILNAMAQAAQQNQPPPRRQHNGPDGQAEQGEAQEGEASATGGSQQALEAEGADEQPQAAQ